MVRTPKKRVQEVEVDGIQSKEVKDPRPRDALHDVMTGALSAVAVDSTIHVEQGYLRRNRSYCLLFEVGGSQVLLRML